MDMTDISSLYIPVYFPAMPVPPGPVSTPRDSVPVESSPGGCLFSNCARMCVSKSENYR